MAKNVSSVIVIAMQRSIMSKLIAWKQTSNRKPLIIKGARQVGKTYVLDEFAKSHFTNSHYFNFEREPKLAQIFEESLDPKRIVQALSFAKQKQIHPKTDLIVFDEIQACPKALTSLKYFCEDLPEMSVCAAGSLLGIYLSPASYPVGKVDHLEMHPMSFLEFLQAVGDSQYVELLQQLTATSQIPQIAHDHLWERLRHYFITGGLPEVVKIYCENHETLFECFNLVRRKQADLIEDYFADIAKHSGKQNALHISRIWRNIPEQLAQTQDGSVKKFKFKGVIPGIDRYTKMVDALDWLESAGLILKVNLINRVALPFKAYTKDNAFKLFLFDIGLLGAMSEIAPATILEYDYGSYKGFFAENFVAQAFTYSSSSGLYSWMENTSEIEFVRDIKNSIVPIEVKAGSVIRAKSLKTFSDKYHPNYSVIFSAKNLKIDKEAKIHFLPLYLAEFFPLQ